MRAQHSELYADLIRYLIVIEFTDLTYNILKGFGVREIVYHGHCPQLLPLLLLPTHQYMSKPCVATKKENRVEHVNEEGKE